MTCRNKNVSFSMSISAMGVPKVANDLQYTLLLDDTHLKQVWCRCHPLFFFLGVPKFTIRNQDGWVSLKKIPSSWASSRSAFRAAIKLNLCPFYWHRTNNETRISDGKRSCVIYSSSWQILFKLRCNIYQGTVPGCHGALPCEQIRGLRAL